MAPVIPVSKTVDRTIDEIDAAMRALRDALRGIPFRSGGFKNTHDNLARQMAHLTVLLDAARAAYRQ